MILPDVNLLIHAHNADSPAHDAARRWWDDLLAGTVGVGLAWVAMLGFIRITTHRSILANPLPVTDVLDRLGSWLALPQVHVAAPSSRHYDLLRNLLGQTRHCRQSHHGRSPGRPGDRPRVRAAQHGHGLRPVPGAEVAQSAPALIEVATPRPAVPARPSDARTRGGCWTRSAARAARRWACRCGCPTPSPACAPATASPTTQASRCLRMDDEVTTALLGGMMLTHPRGSGALETK